MKNEAFDMNRNEEFEEMQEPDVQPEESSEMGRSLEEEATTKEIAESEAAQAEEKKEKTYTEEMRVTVRQLQGTIQKLLRESNVRRIKIKNRQGRVLLDIPVWAAAAGGTALVLAAPIITVIGVAGGAIYGLRVEVERVEEK